MKTILVVEDQNEVRELVQVTLRSDGWQILEARNGAQALDMARRHKPDLVLMDVMMPGELNGFEATRALKDDPSTSGVTVIMLTAKGQQSDLAYGREVGADGYFTKPFSPLELIRRVETLFEDGEPA
jgi:DNA-binding response OmpR family regulator